MPDTHAPFFDRRAWKAMLKYARDFQPDTVVHLGDLGDFFAVSAHDKDPRRSLGLKEECEITNACLDDLDGLGAKKNILTRGNHEYRLDRYLMQRAPELIGVTDVNELFNLKKRGWVDVPYRKHIQIGKLYCTHEGGYSGAGAVRQMARLFGHSVAFGHTHLLESLYFGNVLGERYVAASCGWLGDIEAADYLPAAAKERWQHGFGVVQMEPSGAFQLQLIPIVDGRVIAA